MAAAEAVGEAASLRGTGICVVLDSSPMRMHAASDAHASAVARRPLIRGLRRPYTVELSLTASGEDASGTGMQAAAWSGGAAPCLARFLRRGEAAAEASCATRDCAASSPEEALPSCACILSHHHGGCSEHALCKDICALTVGSTCCGFSEAAWVTVALTLASPDPRTGCSLAVCLLLRRASLPRSTCPCRLLP